MGEGTPRSMISCDPTLTKIHYLYSACLARHERSKVGVANAAHASAKRVRTTISAPLDVVYPNGTYPSFSEWVTMAFCVIFESPLCSLCDLLCFDGVSIHIQLAARFSLDRPPRKAGWTLQQNWTITSRREYPILYSIIYCSGTVYAKIHTKKE
jgi:hypothetical protein